MGGRGLATRIVPFEAEHIAAVRDFNASVWERPSSRAFMKWRYLDCPAQWGLLAMRDGRCIATIWGRQRWYRVAGDRVAMLEPFDWHTLPEALHSGIGIRMLRRVMQRPEPSLAVGGTELTRTFLPRLGWRDLGASRSYLLPLASKVLAHRLAEKGRLPRLATSAIAIVATRTWCRPRRQRAPDDGSVETVEGINEEILALYQGEIGYGCVGFPDKAWHEWLSSGAAGVGRITTLLFRNGDAPVGWALGRDYGTAHGREATIVDIFTPHPRVEVYAWMVSALLERLADARVVQVRARATCPVLGRALKNCGFIAGPTSPVAFWSTTASAPPTPIHMTGDTGDSAYHPYDIDSG